MAGGGPGRRCAADAETHDEEVARSTSTRCLPSCNSSCISGDPQLRAPSSTGAGDDDDIGSSSSSGQYWGRRHHSRCLSPLLLPPRPRPCHARCTCCRSRCCQRGCVWGWRAEALGAVTSLLALLAAGRCAGRVGRDPGSGEWIVYAGDGGVAGLPACRAFAPTARDAAPRVPPGRAPTTMLTGRKPVARSTSTRCLSSCNSSCISGDPQLRAPSSTGAGDDDDIVSSSSGQCWGRRRSRCCPLVPAVAAPSSSSLSCPLLLPL
jgi:hypothetical protein